MVWTTVCFQNPLRNVANSFIDGGNDPWMYIRFAIWFGSLPALALMVTFSWLTSTNRPPDDGHLHCLKCGYVLKGLSEPRCPECGERI